MHLFLDNDDDEETKTEKREKADVQLAFKFSPPKHFQNQIELDKSMVKNHLTPGFYYRETANDGSLFFADGN